MRYAVKKKRNTFNKIAFPYEAPLWLLHHDHAFNSNSPYLEEINIHDKYIDHESNVIHSFITSSYLLAQLLPAQ